MTLQDAINIPSRQHEWPPPEYNQALDLELESCKILLRLHGGSSTPAMVSRLNEIVFGPEPPAMVFKFPGVV